MEDVTATLRACIVAHKGGILQEKLDDAYFTFTGAYIPYLTLGFPSLYQYLRTVKDIVKTRNESGELVYSVSSQKVDHINRLVQKQKEPGIMYRKAAMNTKKSWIRDAKRKAANDGRRSKRRDKRPRNEGIYEKKMNHSMTDDDKDYDSPQDISDYDHWYQDEYNHPVQIFEGLPKMNVVYEPLVAGKQLIGDDFFLQLAIRNVGAPVWRKKPCTALHSGLCISGQTIKDAYKNLLKVDNLSNKIVILLGAEDLYRGHSSDDMIEDMENLLSVLEDRFAYSRNAITLCTIPPLANLALNLHQEQLANLQRYNAWLRLQTNVMQSGDAFEDCLRYNLVEFYHNNTDARIMTAYEYFQLDARMVSGTPHPYVLWNVRGRRLAMNLLRH